MNYEIMLDGNKICQFEINDEEIHYEVITAKYKPFLKYHTIKHLIKEYSKLVISKNIIEINNDSRYTGIRDKVYKLKLYVKDNFGNNIVFSRIDLRDYSDDLGDEGYELYLYK